MEELRIEGGRPLRGEVRISGSKNAALPILIATLLTDEPCRVQNVPRLRDIRTTIRLLESLGKRVRQRGSAVEVLAHGPLETQAPYEIVKQMRASVLAAGPLLARFGRVRVPIPGGCAIGLRPIDIHLKGFEGLGAGRSVESGDLVLRGALRPGRVRLSYPSVGATENLMMAAAGVAGLTVIENAAREPELSDLGDFLGRMGARVRGAGTRRIEVLGARSLGGCSHRVIPDRIEAGTFLLACAAAGGSLRLLGARPGHLEALTRKMRAAGAGIRELPEGLEVEMEGRPRPVSIETRPYPGFPTDLQAPWMAWMCLARGRCRIVETVFENRFLHAAELSRMGGRITLRGHAASVEGVPRLFGAPIMASDIRAGAALLVAALAARGRTLLARVYHVDRGYERLEAKLRRVGAQIRRLRK